MTLKYKRNLKLIILTTILLAILILTFGDQPIIAYGI